MTNANTFADTCMLFSCMFIMASDILTSIGSMTNSMLNGPSSRSATKSIASVKTQEHDLLEKRELQVLNLCLNISNPTG